MAQSQRERDSQVLPFDQSDIVNGIGEIRRIVDMSSHVDEEGVTSDGRCAMCGYDRADLSTHTEVEAWSLTCRQCNYIVGGEV